MSRLPFAALTAAGLFLAAGGPAPAQTQSPLVSAVLPGSRSVQIGAPATLFSTIINAGPTDLGGCRTALPSGAPGGLALDYRTNFSGSPLNQPVPIAAGKFQNFILIFSAAAPLTTLGQALVYACDGTPQAPNTPGVNTVDLLFSATPVPDIVAEALTLSRDGIVAVPFGQGRGSAFAISTYNTGIGGRIVVSADTGPANLPVTVTVCDTVPAPATCRQAPAPSIQVDIPSGGITTFSVFVNATDVVPFVPETNRVFVRYNGADGVFHGSTSVAIRSQ